MTTEQASEYVLHMRMANEIVSRMRRPGSPRGLRQAVWAMANGRMFETAMYRAGADQSWRMTLNIDKAVRMGRT